MIDIVRHEVFGAFGSLHLKCVPLFIGSRATLLVFGNRTRQSLNITRFRLLDPLVLPQPLLCLLLVLLPREDQTEVLLLQVNDVGAKVLWVLKWQLVGAV